MVRKILSKQEMLDSCVGQEVFVLCVDRRPLKIQNVAAIIVTQKTDVNECIKEFQNSAGQKIEVQILAKVSILHLMSFFENNHCAFIYVYNVGFIKKEDTVRIDKNQISNLAKKIWDKLDSDCFFTILKNDNPIKNAGAISVYLDEKAAMESAISHGGTVNRTAFVAPLFDGSLLNYHVYNIDGEYYTMAEFLQALMLKFKAQILPFESVKSLMEQGLCVYAGEENGKIKIFKNINCSTFFTRDVSETNLPNEIRNEMPPNARFIPLQNKEDCYNYIYSKYVFFNGARHTTNEIIHNVISGYNYKKVWQESEIREKLKNLQEQEKLYVVVDRELLDSGRGYPYIINKFFPTFIIFSDLGKALLWAQGNNKYSDDGRVLIGEINNFVPGNTFIELLSMGHWAGVQGVEFDPGEEQRLYIELPHCFKSMNIEPLSQEQIYKLEPLTDEESFVIEEMGFNPLSTI